MKSGGYDSGYQACSCFWGTEPSSLVRQLSQVIRSFDGLTVLDVGCGEGKNGVFFAVRGAHVRALDISEIAIAHGRETFSHATNVSWEVTDIRDCALPSLAYDIVVAYGLLHCLRSELEIMETVAKLMNATKPNGFHLLCSFNNRYQELHAHPGFTPILLAHQRYRELYAGWEILHESDENLTETHPHNGIIHTHSMTRLIAKKRSYELPISSSIRS